MMIKGVEKKALAGRQAAISQFGSGWAWLVQDAKNVGWSRPTMPIFR